MAEIFPDYEELKLKGIEGMEAINEYFNKEIKRVNSRMAPHKTIRKVKIREEEFKKNTSKKILRFAIDKNIDN